MITNSLFFRETIPADLPLINSILNHIIITKNYNLSNVTKSMEETQTWYENHQNSDYYVSLSAILDNEFVGWVSLSPFRSADGYNITAELSVYVHPDFYRRGIAQRMMQEIESYAIKKGKLQSIISVITGSNNISIALHQKMGYDTVGILKEIAIKDGKLEDVVLMMKRIPIERSI